MTWILTTAVIFLIYLIQRWLLKPLTYWKKKGVAHVKSIPLFGNSLWYIMKRKSLSEITEEIYRELGDEKFGGYFWYMCPSIMIKDPEIANRILVTEFANFHDRGEPVYSEPMLDNLVALCGEKWRTLRHSLTPVFTSSKLKMMFDQIVACSDEKIRRIKLSKMNREIEVGLCMRSLNLSIIGSVGFGLNIDACYGVQGQKNQFIDYSDRFFRPSLQQRIKGMIMFMFPRFSKWIRLKWFDEEVRSFFVGLVKDTIEHREKTGSSRNDFLQLMIDLRKNQEARSPRATKFHDTITEEDLESGDQQLLEQLSNTPVDNSLDLALTDEWIAGQAFMFISGGSDVNAGALAFTLYELAANPELQTRVRKEVENVFPNGVLTFDLMKRLTYTEQFIYEVFRMHNPSSTLLRVCTKDCIIPGTEFVIKKGMSVLIPISAIHKDPKYFVQPELFDPERFSDMSSIPKPVFLPFGSGPRMCIASRFVILEMKIFLARLLMTFNLRLSPKTQLPLTLMPNSMFATSEKGIWIRYEPRNL